MELFNPLALITPTLDAQVLQALLKSNHGLTSGQVHRMAGRGSRSGIVNTLERLVTQGIVWKEVAGRVYVYEFNHEHIAARSIKELALTQERWLIELAREIERWDPQPLYVAVVGKSHLHTHGATDPIELLFIFRSDEQVETSTDQIHGLCKMSYELTGSETVPIIHSLASLNTVPPDERIGWLFKRKVIMEHPGFFGGMLRGDLSATTPSANDG